MLANGVNNAIVQLTYTKPNIRGVSAARFWEISEIPDTSAISPPMPTSITVIHFAATEPRISEKARRHVRQNLINCCMILSNPMVSAYVEITTREQITNVEAITVTNVLGFIYLVEHCLE